MERERIEGIPVYQFDDEIPEDEVTVFIDLEADGETELSIDDPEQIEI